MKATYPLLILATVATGYLVFEQIKPRPETVTPPLAAAEKTHTTETIAATSIAEPVQLNADPSSPAAATPPPEMPASAEAPPHPKPQSDRAPNPIAPGTARAKPELADPTARVALSMVGADPEAEAYWYDAINDATIPAHERQDLIEDLNEEGFDDPKHPSADDLPLIMNRLAIIDLLAPDAMDQVNEDAFGEAAKDLQNMALKAWTENN